jgi:hypothetical protein
MEVLYNRPWNVSISPDKWPIYQGVILQTKKHCFLGGLFEGVNKFESVAPPMGRSGYRNHTCFLGAYNIRNGT